MCLISRPVELVDGTKILVGINKNKTRQITVYSNKVKNRSDSNAMILPVPNPESIKFINLTDYKNIFDDCDSCFHSYVLGINSYVLGTNSLNSHKLEVFDIGSYKVSLAMNLDELEHVDESVFKLSKGCNKVLSKYYNEKYWGFIILKLVS
jgi:hypothetical protein